MADVTAPGVPPFKPAFAAWYGLLQVSTRLTERISAELEAHTGLSLAWFELVMQLHWSEDGRQRMSDLADALLLSRGGTTRLVARVEEAGLVVRMIPPDDRRATYAVLTPAGHAAAEAALPVHVQLVQRSFHAFVDDEELHTLVRVFNRVLQANAWPCRPVTEAAAGLEAPGAAPD
jgi:DNA-binding MarR family transcriptional regulator